MILMYPVRMKAFWNGNFLKWIQSTFSLRLLLYPTQSDCSLPCILISFWKLGVCLDRWEAITARCFFCMNVAGRSWWKEVGLFLKVNCKFLLMWSIFNYVETLWDVICIYSRCSFFFVFLEVIFSLLICCLRFQWSIKSSICHGIVILKRIIC